jgi:hypothetical protein
MALQLIAILLDISIRHLGWQTTFNKIMLVTELEK